MKRHIVSALLLALPPVGVAAEPSVVRGADRTVVRKRTVVDFTEVAVEGSLTKPDGAYALSRKKTRFRSLVKVRDNFLPELQKSVDSLR